MDREKLQQTVERAIQALEELEQALHEGNHRKIGAKTAELRRTLQEAKNHSDRSKKHERR